MTIADTAAWKALQNHVPQMQQLHLRDLLQDADRSDKMIVESDGVCLDASRQLVSDETCQLLLDLAKEAKLSDKIQAMCQGEKINRTEGRAVLHVALRAAANADIQVDGENVVPAVHEVLGCIQAFSEQIRSGAWTGVTGKPLTDVIAIGIGGSYLGPEFVFESLRHDADCAQAAAGRRLRFLANVDPIDVSRALEGFDPETTLVVVISKTFTTAETMLNAKTVRAWLTGALGAEAVAKHMVAVSTNLDAVAEFGIDPANAFGFWDWVGGRYSVCSAVGVLPLALQYGFAAIRQFLDGAQAMDRHFQSAPLAQNLPVLLGLYGVWNASFLGYRSRALLPYCQALLKFAPHIQQVDMESNGKRVTMTGEELGFDLGEVDFGEPGTNGQHSFYQLMHQGQVVPADFIGFKRSQTPFTVDGHPVPNHDELMANYFAQPDALALGKTAEECQADGVAAELVPHKVFPGNRPSNVLLLDQLTPFTTGQLLALYEHRTAVQGFIWDINSFDQWGVELGKVLAKKAVAQLAASRGEQAALSGFVPSTTTMMKKYLK
jgi:glucose-6-phosphate isomerase